MAKKRPAARRPGAARSGNPAARASAGTRARPPEPPAKASLRRRFERLSAPALITLHSLPRFVLPVAMGSVLLLGLVLSGTWAWLGALCMASVALVVLWLYAVSWPVLTPAARLFRGLVVLALLGFTVLKAMGRL